MAQRLLSKSWPSDAGNYSTSLSGAIPRTATRPSPSVPRPTRWWCTRSAVSTWRSRSCVGSTRKGSLRQVGDRRLTRQSRQRLLFCGRRGKIDGKIFRILKTNFKNIILRTKSCLQTKFSVQYLIFRNSKIHIFNSISTFSFLYFRFNQQPSPSNKNDLPNFDSTGNLVLEVDTQTDDVTSDDVTSGNGRRRNIVVIASGVESSRVMPLGNVTRALKVNEI